MYNIIVNNPILIICKYPAARTCRMTSEAILRLLRFLFAVPDPALLGVEERGAGAECSGELGQESGREEDVAVGRA